VPSRDNFGFYYLALDLPAMVVNHPYGTIETKKVYYAALKRFTARAAELWSHLDQQKVPADLRDGVEKALRVARKILERHAAKLDDASQQQKSG
jgi:hypothetical protein